MASAKTEQIQRALSAMLAALGDRASAPAQAPPEVLVAQIVSKRFRKWRVRPKARRRIEALVEGAVAEGAPIRFTVNFGGYKHWSVDDFPQAAWSELFMLCYHLEYLRPIADRHPPGVELAFLSNDVVIERANNVEHAHQERYLETLQALFDAFARLVPANMALRLVRIVPDLYPPAERDVFEADLKAACAQTEAKLAEMSPEAIAKRLAKSAFNIWWPGKEPWDRLDDAERTARARHGLILADSIGKVARRRQFDPLGQTVRLFCAPFSNNVAIGTTRASVTKFWTGSGVLERRADRVVPRVLSPRQLEVVRPALERVPSGLAHLGPVFETVLVHQGQMVW